MKLVSYLSDTVRNQNYNMKKFLNYFKGMVISIVLILNNYLIVFGLSPDFKIFPELEGWKKPESPSVYHPDNLWDLINGAADVYLSYDFEELTLGNYTREDGTYIALELYRHASEEDAFGIYSQERPLSGNYLQVGAEGYQGQGILNFVAGNYYIKISSHNYDAECLSDMKSLAVSVADLIEPDASLPSELGFFPSENKIDKSEQYINNNFLGMSFLGNAFIASYKSSTGETHNLFIIKNDDIQLSSRMLNDYLKYAKAESTEKQGRYIVNDRFNGMVGILWEADYLCGFYGLEDKSAQERYFIWFEQILKK